MKPTDFVYILHFIIEEVYRSGVARLEDVDYRTIHRLDRVRELAGFPIWILYNGLTSGKHNATGHTKGVAVDCHARRITHSQAVRLCFLAAECGFNTIGVYLNKKGYYSFHFEISKEHKTWFAKRVGKKWVYSPLKFAA